MAMTKREQAEVEAIKAQAAIARSVSYPTFPRPTPLLIDRTVVQHGYAAKVHRAVSDGAIQIDELWRQHGCCYRFDVTAEPNRGGGFQNGPTLYATSEDAARAAAFEIADRFGQVMASVYERCYAPPAPSKTEG